MTRGRLAMLVLVGVVLLVVAVAASGLWLKEAGDFYKFDGVSGPPGQSAVATAQPAHIADFDHGGPHRLAVLVTDPASDWLGLARAFKAEGIPFTVTQDPQRARSTRWCWSSDYLGASGAERLAASPTMSRRARCLASTSAGAQPVFGIRRSVAAARRWFG